MYLEFTMFYMMYYLILFFFKQKTAYEMRISDWSSDVCSSDLSENCYDALSHKFDWSKLDTCGAFDQAAVHAADTTDLTGLSKEASYFQSEVAAGRYTAAATRAGAEAEAADHRLADGHANVPAHGRGSG